MASDSSDKLALSMVSAQGREPVVISVDAMGGDRGPAAVVAGLVLVLRDHDDLHVILHGDEAQIAPLLAREPALRGRVTLRHSDRVVTMGDKPSQVMRHGQGTSMWSAIDSVKEGEARVAVSCGNTGALMAVSMLRLRKLPGINRPAIACLWPSRSPQGWSVMLDVGADIRADAEDLLQYAIMGAAYASDALALDLPKVGLMNVGTEEHKGRPELKEAHELLTRAAGAAAGFDYVGFIEGSDLPSPHVNVIVMDGFTGNVALKTGEGTAKLVGDFLREAFSAGILSRFAALLALNSLKRLQKRIDPRRVNGGVFLGLNGAVVKSHGGADATGVAAAVGLAHRLARSGFTERLAARVASVAAAGQDAAAVEPAEQARAGSDPQR
ncbi:phosphate acyltransferase PlsX [Xinfangfangia pollutisoli]|uniref:phosphate acyltransferase PlsX n=1 Tax=Xinfangfangia pollutisoli TaxID=2865960 RepID=UPI00384D24E4